MLGFPLQEIARPGATQAPATRKFLPFVSDRPFLSGKVSLGGTSTRARQPLRSCTWN